LSIRDTPEPPAHQAALPRPPIAVAQTLAHASHRRHARAARLIFAKSYHFILSYATRVPTDAIMRRRSDDTAAKRAACGAACVRKKKIVHHAKECEKRLSVATRDARAHALPLHHGCPPSPDARRVCFPPYATRRLLRAEEQSAQQQCYFHAPSTMSICRQQPPLMHDIAAIISLTLFAAIDMPDTPFSMPLHSRRGGAVKECVSPPFCFTAGFCATPSHHRPASPAPAMLLPSTMLSPRHITDTCCHTYEYPVYATPPRYFENSV